MPRKKGARSQAERQRGGAIPEGTRRVGRQPKQSRQGKAAEALNGGEEAATAVDSARKSRRMASTCPFYTPPSLILSSPPRERKRLNLHAIREVPLYMADNPHILSGYRLHYTTKMCIRSIFSLHNETFNIWTHLLGFILFCVLICFLFGGWLPELDREMALAVRNYKDALPLSSSRLEAAVRSSGTGSEGGSGVLSASPTNGPDPTLVGGAAPVSIPAGGEPGTVKSREVLRQWGTIEALTTRQFVSRLIFALYSLGCLMCMLCSCVFHTFIGHWNTRLYAWAHALDYFGITTLVVGSFLPFCFYCFACEPWSRVLYLGMICSLGIVGILGPFFEKWTSPKFAPIKLTFYVLMVGSGAFPMVHILYTLPYGPVEQHVFGLALMMFLYGFGVFIYATHFPECLFPGRFDLYLSSHQIWHCFVLAAALVHFFNCIGMLTNFKEMLLSC